MPSVEDLKQRLVRLLETRQVDAALGVLSALARKQPDEPSWPRRAARLLRARRDSQGELVALRRALELQVDRGLVLEAIATCKTILELAPDDVQTLECLDLLYLNGASEAMSGDSGTLEPAPDSSSDAPLVSLLLTEVVPDARSVSLGDAAPGKVNEIPVDSMRASSADEVVDLRLDEATSVRDLRAVAAARMMSLPRERPSESGAVARRERGHVGSSLRRELANVPLFGDLDPASLRTLIRKTRVVTLEAGAVLFRQGEPAKSLYVIVDGAVVPIAEGDRRRKLAVLEQGAFFGEIGLLTRQPRNATIEALVDTRLLAIDRRVLWELIRRQPSVAKSLLRFLRARLIDRQIRTNLFFAAFAQAERDAVARQFRIFEVAPGTRIIEQGRPPEGLFVVLAGSLEQVDPKLDKVVTELGLGDVFGGVELIEGRPASWDVVARDKCWLVVLGESRFRRMVEANPRLVRVLRRLAEEERKGGGGADLASL